MLPQASFAAAGGTRNPGQPIVGVHQPDRDCQIGEFLLGEHSRSPWNSASGTVVSATRVTVSAQASAAQACVGQTTGLASFFFPIRRVSRKTKAEKLRISPVPQCRLLSGLRDEDLEGK
jgi:hypothetical protein